MGKTPMLRDIFITMERHSRRWRAWVIALAAAVVLLASARAWAEPGMLGVVLVEDEAGVRAAHILPRSPAAGAGIQTGDLFIQAGGRAVSRVAELHEVLSGFQPGQRVDFILKRGMREIKTSAQLTGQRAYAGDVLHYRELGQTGFPAPPWYVYAWSGLSLGQAAPTLDNTRGKVVVILAFQHTCPRCHTVGFPVMRAVAEHFTQARDVVAFMVQTAFFDPEQNTPEQGELDAKQAGIAAPVGFDAHVDNVAMSVLMATYGMKGTPWTIVIDRDGVVEVNGYTPEDPAGLIARIQALRRPAVSH